MIGVCCAATKEGGEKYMKDQIGIFFHMRNDNLRVQYSAFLALGMIFTNWAPKVQNHCHAMFMPMLLNKMKTEQGKKMQT